MKIFISGATGFIGGHLAGNLINEGHEIKTLVRRSSDVSFIKELRVEMAYGDLTDYLSVKTAVGGCEVIYHTAVAVPGTGPKRSLSYDVNVKGTRNIMRAALETGTRHVVYCSTVAVHGQLQKTPADEGAPFNPDSTYQVTKLEGERVVLGYVRQHKLSAVIARLTFTYGPRNLRWVKIFRDVLNGRLTMIGSGKLYYHITYVDDIVDGLKLCGKEHNSAGECYIIGSEEVQTLGQFIGMIAEEGGVGLRQRKLPAAPFVFTYNVWRAMFKPFGFEPNVMDTIDFFTRERVYDISKAKRELGYSPQVSLREGVRRTLRWYRENGYL